MPEYKTNDLALAAWLTYSGHCHQRIERRGKRAVFVFAVIGDLTLLIEQYTITSDDCLVEPRRFTQVLADVRGTMYDHLDGAS